MPLDLDDTDTEVVDEGRDNRFDIVLFVDDTGIPGDTTQLHDSMSLTVQVTDVNETPVVSGDASVDFDEISYEIAAPDGAQRELATYTFYDDDFSDDDPPGGSVTWSVGGTDAGFFDIGSGGVLSFKPRSSSNGINADAPNDADSNNDYDIQIRADDGAGESNSVGTLDVTINVKNIDEPPEVSASVSPDSEGVINYSVPEVEYDWQLDLPDRPGGSIDTFTARDEEGESIRWSKTGSGYFTIDLNSGELRVRILTANVVDFEHPQGAADTPGGDLDNTYDFFVYADDGNTSVPDLANRTEVPVLITITDVNERPDILSGAESYMFAEIEFDVPASADVDLELGDYFAVDYDEGDTVTWSVVGLDSDDFEITQTTDATTGETTGTLSFKQRPDFEQPSDRNDPEDPNVNADDNKYQITVRATDNHGREKDRDVTVTVTPVDETPAFTGSPSGTESYAENDTSAEDAEDVADYAARDEEGTAIQWSLLGADRSRFNINSAGVLRFRARTSYESPNDSGRDRVYNVTVRASDGVNHRDHAVAVTVTDVEEAGVVAVAAGDESPAVDDTITFTLTDPDGGVADHRSASQSVDWLIQRRPPGGSWSRAFLSNSYSATYTYTVVEADTGRELRARPSYYDRRSADTADEKLAASPPTDPVTADPRVNVEPRLPTDRFTIDEGPAGRDVGTLVATDRDGDAVTFKIKDGTYSDLFELVSLSRPREVTLRAAQALDFEQAQTPGIVIQLSDGKDEDGESDDAIDREVAVGILVFDLEEEGVISFSPTEPEVGASQTATLSDGDGGVVGEMWQWARSASAAGPFSNIGVATSDSYTPVDGDEGQYLRATVTYTDRRGPKSASAITGPVPSENRRPVFPSTETGARSVDEHTRAGQNVGAPVAADDRENDRLTYTLGGADADSFTIVSGSGQIRTSAALDYEDKSSYSVTVSVHDGRDGAGDASNAIDDTQDVTITVVNVDEAGVVTLDSATGTVQARVDATASLADPDGMIVSVSWQWSRSPNGRTGWVPITTATSATYRVQDADEGAYLRATASYNDGHGAGKTAEAVSSRVAEPPPVNSAPVFPAAETGKRGIAENAAAGTAAGAPVAAVDVNAGDAMVNDPLVYSLSGTDAGSFTIDAATGQISLATGVTLDYELKRSYRVVVSVHDGRDRNGDDDMGAIDATINVTIEVTNVDEPPVVTGEATVRFEEERDAAVGQYRAADPERKPTAWSLSGTDAGRFWISSSGQLYFSTPPSFEDGTTSFSLSVDSSDGGLTGSLAVTVTLVDAEDEGAVAVTPPRGWVGMALSASMSDDDGSVSGLTWQWSRSRNRSSWVDISGARASSYTPTADDVDHYLQATASYSDRRGVGKTAATAMRSQVAETAPTSNEAPEFADATATRQVGQGTASGRAVGSPVRATDPDTDDVLVYSLSGADADSFGIDSDTGQIRTLAVLDPAVKDTYQVTVSVSDGFDAALQESSAADDTIAVTITVLARTVGPLTVGAGGGGAPAVATPSEADFEWNVTRDIETLRPEHRQPTDIWSDGETVWVLENGTEGADQVYTYGLWDGAALDLGFGLDSRNRFAHGIWSDGETVWVADSGQDRLLAYRLADGQRVPELDLALAERNADPRGVWSDGVVIYVLDSVQDALFAYDLADGELLAEYALASLNASPRGVWSDGVTFWVSDDGANRVFAYRLEDGALVRYEAEEFGFQSLLSAGNGDPRGIWSDGEVLLVVDAQDRRVYSYNMPSAIDVRLSALRLSGVDIGAFSPGRREYAGVAREATTTIAATPAAAGARATITPADADPASGHQVAVAPGVEIAVTVDSADGSRTGVYRVRLLQGNRPPTLRALSLVELRVGGPAAAIALTELAADPDGDTLSYEVSMSTHPAVATVREQDGVLIVSPVSPGRALFTVSASDGRAASEPITVSVEVAADDAPTAIRIAAQRADDGRIEFALQLRSAAGDWGPRLAPRVRFLPPAEPERWLVSSPLAVLVDAERERTAEVRIAARWRSGGHVEFALQVRGANGDWGERILPRLRFLAPGQGVARWLSSSPTDIVALSPALDEVAELRVGARRLADGRVEVALITVDPFGAAGERRLPAARHLPAAPPPDRWFNSGVLTVLADASTGAAVDVRISLRQRSDGRTEMALQLRQNGVWQDRSLPTSRYLPPTADIDHWLTSSPIPTAN